MGKNKTGRNDPCHCDSNLKFKKCHGDYVKIEKAKTAYLDKMSELIEEEKGKEDDINRGPSG